MFRFALPLLALATGFASAAEKELVYVQKTGKMTLDGKDLGTGYSGHGEGVNNPAKEDVKNVGPIPAGNWTVGKAFKHDTKMPEQGLSPADRAALALFLSRQKGQEWGDDPPWIDRGDHARR